MAQFPYLISGGIAGLAIVVIGAAMLIVQNAREDRARIEAAARAARHCGRGRRRLPPADRAAGAQRAERRRVLVLAGTTSYHRLDCTLSEARDEAHVDRPRGGVRPADGALPGVPAAGAGDRGRPLA